MNLMRELAVKVLELLQKEKRATPAWMRESLQVPAGTLRNVLVVLSDLRLIETFPARGNYRITQLGEQTLKAIKDIR